MAARRFFAIAVALMATTAATATNLDKKSFIRKDRQLGTGNVPTPAPVAPDPTMAPTNPDLFVCEICGEGNVVTIPDGEVTIPTQGSFTCSDLETSASMGLINPAQCNLLTPFVEEPCGCGDGEPADPTDAPEPADPTDAPEPADPTDAPEECKTIADIACGSDDFSMLCELVVQAGLDIALSDPEESLTVFAPNNAAFEAIADVLPSLTEEEVVTILLYHAVQGVVLAEDLVCDSQVEMIDGLFTETQCLDDGSIFQVGTGNSALNAPRIIAVDIEACNGVVHVVDNVILPGPPAETEDIVVDVTIVFDGFAPEIGWSIATEEGEVIIDVPIGTYAPFTVNVTEPVVLQTSTDYVFTIIDQFGDGLTNPTDGSYVVITSADGEILVEGGGNFGFENATSFTTPDAP